MKNNVFVPSDKVFVEWALTQSNGMDLTEEEARLLIGYVTGHGCCVTLDNTGTIILVDTEEPENGIVATGFEELIERVSTWNYEFIQDSEVAGADRKRALDDAKMIDDILDRMGSREGHLIGTPTVKEMISILSKFPEDYKVTCRGAKSYLFINNGYIIIDCERSLF